MSRETIMITVMKPQHITIIVRDVINFKNEFVFLVDDKEVATISLAQMIIMRENVDFHIETAAHQIYFDGERGEG